MESFLRHINFAFIAYQEASHLAPLVQGSLTYNPTEMEWKAHEIFSAFALK